MEGNSAISSKTMCAITLPPTNSIPRNLPQIYTSNNIKMQIPKVIHRSNTYNYKIQKIPKCLSTGDQLHKLWYIDRMRYKKFRGKAL